eukprot:1791208-Rhodomonas_salina.2
MSVTEWAAKSKTCEDDLSTVCSTEKLFLQLSSPFGLRAVDLFMWLSTKITQFKIAKKGASTELQSWPLLLPPISLGHPSTSRTFDRRLKVPPCPGHLHGDGHAC